MFWSCTVPSASWHQAASASWGCLATTSPWRPELGCFYSWSGDCGGVREGGGGLSSICHFQGSLKACILKQINCVTKQQHKPSQASMDSQKYSSSFLVGDTLMFCEAKAQGNWVGLPGFLSQDGVIGGPISCPSPLSPRGENHSLYVPRRSGSTILAQLKRA